MKRWISSERDCWDLLKSRPLNLDYRSYDKGQSSNIGDFAISIAITSMLNQEEGATSYIPVNWGSLQQCIHGKNFSPSDWVVVAGGGYIFFSPDGALSSRIESDLQALGDTNMRLALVGIGINQQIPDTSAFHISDAAGNTIKRVLEKASYISVRDVFSRDVLASFTDKPVVLTGDPALHLADLLNINSTKRITHRKTTIGLNLPFHGPTSSRILSRNLRSYIAALHTIQARHDCTFKYFSHYETESLIPKLLRRSGIKVEIASSDLACMLQEYAELDLHIGGMLHSCIFAHSVDTPCIGLAYDIKHQGFFDLFSLPQQCLSAFEFDQSELLDRVDRTMSENQEIRSHIQKNRIHLQAINKEFISTLSSHQSQTDIH